MEKFESHEDIARWQYQRRQCLKWLRRLSLSPAIIAAIAALLAIFNGVPALVGLWVALLGSILSIAAWFIPKDERTREQGELDEYLDTNLRRR